MYAVVKGDIVSSHASEWTLAFKVALEALEHRAWACINGSAPPTPVRIYINVQHIPYNCPDIPPAALDCTEEAILPESFLKISRQWYIRIASAKPAMRFWEFVTIFSMHPRWTCHFRRCSVPSVALHDQLSYSVDKNFD
ncbi:hypothetical protein MCOR02_010398 [Pyricularia oryzae]|nr:hypothetical protein MCOR02_010398 [Pyricularia oryzae]